MNKLFLKTNKKGTPYSLLIFLMGFNIVFFFISWSVIDKADDENSNTMKILGYVGMAYTTTSLLFKAWKWQTFKIAWFSNSEEKADAEKGVAK